MPIYSVQAAHIMVRKHVEIIEDMEESKDNLVHVRCLDTSRQGIKQASLPLG